MAYDNTNRGVAFINDTKEGNQPDLKGSINVDGVEWWVSCWWKTPTKGGDDFLSISIQPKQGQGQRTPAEKRPMPARGRGRPQPSQGGGDDEDIPFAPMGARAAWSAI